MKTFRSFLSILVPLVLLCGGVLPLSAQDEGGFFTVSGMVRDGENRRPMANVSVSIPDTPVGTITNADGTFALKIRRDQAVSHIEFSHVGYQSRQLALTGGDQPGVAVELARRGILIEGIDIYNRDARDLVESALLRVGNNYSDRAALLTGFYRETVQKRQTYVDIAEAVEEIYATPYSQGIRGENVRIVKGRRLMSPRAADTLAVVLQGGPNLYIFGNVVRNPDFVLDIETLHFYRFRIEEVVSVNDRPHDVVSFGPQVVLTDQALFVGKLFIDRETLTISRAEFGMDMSDPDKVTQTILRRKPTSLRFYPDQVLFVMAYREHEGRSYLHYAANTLRFRCDWRRRLFRTSYTVNSETVITDARRENIERIPSREAFRQYESLSQRISDFNDPGFWEAYNIIEPTESLEAAVERLRKRVQQGD